MAKKQKKSQDIGKPNFVTQINGDKQKYIAQSKKDVAAWFTYFRDNNLRFTEYQEFSLKENASWPERERQRFDNLNKPRLTFNRIPDSVQRVVGQYKKLDPALMVYETGSDDKDEGSEENQKKMEMLTDFLRNLAFSSESKHIYSRAFENQLIGGYGVVRVKRDYEENSAFDQKLFLEVENNPRMCFFDPNAKKLSKCDGRFSGNLIFMPKDEFDSKYPDHEDARSFGWTDTDGYMDLPEVDDYICIALYDVKMFYKEKMAKVFDGQTTKELPYAKAEDLVKKSKADARDAQEMYPGALTPPIFKIVEEGTRDTYEIMHLKVIGNDILEVTPWGGKYFSNIFADGASAWLRGKQYIVPFAMYGADTVRFTNYLGSAIADNLINGQVEVPIMHETQMPTDERRQADWLDRSKNPGVLLVGGSPQMEKPMWKPSSELPPTYINMFQVLQGTFQQITGMFDANIGAPSREISGVAKEKMISQASLSTFTCFDNNLKLLQHVGKSLLDLLPTVYDSDRVVSTTSVDGNSKNVRINKVDGSGENYENNIGDGDYAVKITAGASYDAQQEEERNYLMAAMQLEGPDGMSKYGDLWASTTNMEITPKLIERSKYSLSDGILLAEDPEFFEKKQKISAVIQKLRGPNPAMMMQQQQMQLEQKKIKNEDQKLQLDAAKMGQEHYANTVKTGAEVQKSQDEVQKSQMEFQGKRLDMIVDQNKQINSSLEQENRILKEKLGEIEQMLGSYGL